MKFIIAAHLLILLIYGCGLRQTKDEVSNFIPGTYIRYSQHEFGHEYDTLVITLQNKDANEYKILRKWKYERWLDGKVVEPEYKVMTTSGIYDARQNLLQETRSGQSFSFAVKDKVLFEGPNKFQKL